MLEAHNVSGSVARKLSGFKARVNRGSNEPVEMATGDEADAI